MCVSRAREMDIMVQKRDVEPIQGRGGIHGEVSSAKGSLAGPADAELGGDGAGPPAEDGEEEEPATRSWYERRRLPPLLAGFSSCFLSKFASWRGRCRLPPCFAKVRWYSSHSR